METSGKRSFVKGAAILGIAGLLCKVIGAFFRIPLYNMIGDGMVYYEAVYPWYSTLIVVSTAGIPTAISKLVAERVTLGDFAGAKKVFRRAQLLLLGIGLVTTAMLLFGAEAIVKLQQTGEGAVYSFRALAPALLFVSLMCAYRGYLQGVQLMAGTAISQLIEQIGKLAVGLYLASAFLPYGLEYAAMGALIGVTASELMALIVIAVIFRSRRRRFLPVNVPQRTKDSGIIGQLLAMAIPVTIGASIMPLTGVVDSMLIMPTMLKLGLTEAEASMRYVALRTNVAAITNMPALLTTALSMSLVPAISSARARKDKKSIHGASRMGMKLAMVIGLPCGIGLFVLGGQAVDLLYDIDPTRLYLCAKLMRISAIGIIFLSLVQTMTGIIQGLGRPLVPVVNLALGAVTKIIIMLTLMQDPRIEIYGAALSTVACYAVAGIADAIYLVRKTRLRVGVINTFLKPLFASLVMGVAAFFAYVFFSASLSLTSLSTLLAIMVAAVIYVILLFLLRIFTVEDLKLIPGGRTLARLMYGGKR